MVERVELNSVSAQCRLGVNYFAKVINYIQLHWKLFNKITITITWLLSKVINYIQLLCQM